MGDFNFALGSPKTERKPDLPPKLEDATPKPTTQMITPLLPAKPEKRPTQSSGLPVWMNPVKKPRAPAVKKTVRGGGGGKRKPFAPRAKVLSKPVVRPKKGKRRLPAAKTYQVGRRGLTHKGKHVMVRQTKDGLRWRPAVNPDRLHSRLRRKFEKTGNPSDRRRSNKNKLDVRRAKDRIKLQRLALRGNFGSADVRGVDTKGSK